VAAPQAPGGQAAIQSVAPAERSHAPS
jgi:hypothetical protein